MSKKGKIKRMFPGGNTAKGFHSFFDYITDEDYRLRFIIKGGPGVGKSTFMTSIAQHAIDNGFDIVEYSCATDPDSLDGLYIPAIKVALLDGTAPHAVEPTNPGITDDIIWLGEYWDEDKLLESKDIILKLNKKAGKLFKMAFSQLKEGSSAYDEWRSYIQEGFDVKKYNKILRQVIGELFKDVTWNKNIGGRVTHHFATAISCKGVYSYLEELLVGDLKVYAFSGMPGSGVNKAISRIAGVAEELGLDTQHFHCPFDVDELEMLIIPSLGKAVVNINSISNGDVLQFNPDQEVSYTNFDELLDFETIGEYNEEIEQAKRRFYNLVNGTVEFIARAKATHSQVEEYYVDAMDFQKVNSIREKVMQRIFKTSGTGDDI